MSRLKVRRLVAALVLGAGAIAFSACGAPPASTGTGNTVVIASKNFTENEILGQMMADLLSAKTNLKVTTKLDMNGTVPVFQAIKSGAVDIYPGYTGTGYVDILKQPKPAPEAQMYAYVNAQYKKQFGLELLKPLGFNDTYAIAVTSALAKKDHLTTISSLVPYAQRLTAGIDPECQTRQDCYLGLKAAYGLDFGTVKTMDHSLVEEAMGSGIIQATDVYTTDGALLKYHLVVLKDNKNVFPAYDCVPVVRVDWVRAHPQAVAVINELAGKISDSEMEKLDYQVDVGKESVQSVAHTWLVQQGLL